MSYCSVSEQARWWIRAFALFIGSSVALNANASEPTQIDVFVAGQGSYHTYRIPSLVSTPSGNTLAFCEGRKKGRSDSGDIDLLIRSSQDSGLTWSQPQPLWDDEGHTCGNPCVVFDQTTGTIWLLMTWNAGDRRESEIKPGFGEDSRRVYVTHSTDDGDTWASPREITGDVKRAHWTWYATGPGAGIQIERGPYRNRLVIPCDHKFVRNGKTHYHSHIIYSDDHGKT